jgi:NAD(P)-dependent dehydrogenase (short-subunit alcohol dehydrogenase family)
MPRFAGKSVVITGAGSAPGRAAALQIAKEGGRLTLVDVSESELKQTVEEICAAAPEAEVLSVTANVAEEPAVENYVAEALNRFGRIDAFFNNAGIEGQQNLTADYTSDEFSKVVDINLNGVFYGLKHVLKVMKEQGRGAILNAASVGGIRGVGNQSGYAASKHGVIGLTRNSGIDYGQFGIQINAIAPGAILTPMVENSLKQIDAENWEEVGKQFVEPNPMKRFGQPEEVGHLVAFLLSGDAGFINAAVIPIDGGQSYKY